VIIIKPYGVERSGIGFAAQVIASNFDSRRVFVLQEELTNPHGVPILKCDDVKKWMKTYYKLTPRLVKICKDVYNGNVKLIPLIVTKNPYSWAKSIYRWRRVRQLDYEHEYTLYNVSHNIYKAIIEYPEEFEIYKKGLWFRYEDIINNIEVWLNNIASMLGVNRKRKLIIPKMNLAYEFTAKDRNYYLNGAPFGLDEVIMNKITLLVNWELITTYYGYYPLDPRDHYKLSRQGLAKLTYEMKKSGVEEILKKYNPSKKGEI